MRHFNSSLSNQSTWKRSWRCQNSKKIIVKLIIYDYLWEFGLYKEGPYWLEKGDLLGGANRFVFFLPYAGMVITITKNCPGFKYHLLAVLGAWSKVKVLVAQSCPTLYHPMDCNPPGFSVLGIPQARILEWVAISCSGGSSQLRDKALSLMSPALAGGFFTMNATWEAPLLSWNLPYQ